MTLPDLYEPFFQYVCMLNRFARKTGSESLDCESLRPVITGLLASIKTQSQSDPLLALQAQKLELPITFFIDSMIAESSLACANEWHRNRLAYAGGELAGDEKFFDVLEETMADTSAEATARLVILYVCMGLGFTGWYTSQPEYLRQKMQTIAKRISKTQDWDRAARICPEAYQYLDTRNLIEPPGVKIGAILLSLLGLCLLVTAVNFYLFRVGSISFTESLHEILRHDLVR